MFGATCAMRPSAHSTSARNSRSALTTVPPRISRGFIGRPPTVVNRKGCSAPAAASSRLRGLSHRIVRVRRPVGGRRADGGAGARIDLAGCQRAQGDALGHRADGDAEVAADALVLLDLEMAPA